MHTWVTLFVLLRLDLSYPLGTVPVGGDIVGKLYCWISGIFPVQLEMFLNGNNIC